MYPASTSLSIAIGAVIVSEVRFLRECLAEILARDPVLRVAGACATLAHAVDTVQSTQPEIILLDAAFPDGVGAVERLRASVPTSQIVAIAVAETEENILAWAEAGIAGYVPNTASLRDLTALLKQISHGEQSCSARIAGSLLRRVGGTDAKTTMRGLATVPLTCREIEILRLLGTGLSNKDIARRLGISLGTTKSHVHSVLGKLNLRRRTEIAAQLNNFAQGILPADA